MDTALDNRQLPAMRTLMQTSPALVCAALSAVIAFLFVFFGAFSDDVGGPELIAVGWFSFAIICIAVWTRKSFDVLEPIVLLAISVFIGCTLRSMYLVWSPPGSDAVHVLIGDMDFATIAAYEAVVPVGLAVLSLGYVLWKKRLPIERFGTFRKTYWPSWRLYLVVTVLTIIGMIGAVALIHQTGVSFSSLVGLSQKRTVDESLSGGDQYAHAGYLRWIAQFVKVALLLLYTHWAARRDADGRPRKFGFLRIAILLLLTMMAAAWPIISSSRTGVVEIVFDMMIIYIYERNGGDLRRFFRIGMFCLGFALTVLVVMGLARNLAQRGEIRDTPFVQTFLDQTVGSGNFMPAERTAYIMDHYAGKSFFYGETYFSWLAEPIPKSVWKDRPGVSDMAEFVKGEIYQRDVIQGGYPPGMMGEAYINFGLPGVLLLPFFFGWGLRFAYLTFRPLLGINQNATLTYASILWQIGLQTADLEFSMLMLNIVTTLIPMFAAFWFMKRPPQ